MTIANNGDPIPSERVPHIFERFYLGRGDQRISGHGLRLSPSGKPANVHDGTLSLARSYTR